MPPTVEIELRALTAAVRVLRARERLTQETVARRGDMGLKYVGRLERGELVPGFDALVGIARGLDVPLSELMLVYEERLAATPRRPSPGG